MSKKKIVSSTFSIESINLEIRSFQTLWFWKKFLKSLPKNVIFYLFIVLFLFWYFIKLHFCDTKYFVQNNTIFLLDVIYNFDLWRVYEIIDSIQKQVWIYSPRYHWYFEDLYLFFLITFFLNIKIKKYDKLICFKTCLTLIIFLIR